MRNIRSSRALSLVGLTLALFLCSCKGQIGASNPSKSNNNPSSGAASSTSASGTGTVIAYRSVAPVVIVGKKDKTLVAKSEPILENYQVLAE